MIHSELIDYIAFSLASGLQPDFYYRKLMRAHHKRKADEQKPRLPEVIYLPPAPRHLILVR